MGDTTKRYVLAPLMVLVLLGSCVAIASMNDVKATTWIEGHITEDTTWALANSPYLVTGDILVDEGVTLTIEPGVTVKFGGYIGIFVNGSLYAVGSNTDKISFTSNKPSPEVGDWNMIKFQGTKNETLLMKNITVEYGTCGVAISSIGATLIEKCEFYNNTKGIHIIGNSNTEIKSNTIKFNQIGVSGEGGNISDILIADNIITDNNNAKSPLDAHGIYLITHGKPSARGYLYSHIYNVTIRDNTIYSNGGCGIYLYAYTAPSRHRPTHSHIHNVTIRNNTVSSNGDTGVSLYARSGWSNRNSDSYIYDVTIRNNTVSSNGDTGIYLHAYADTNNAPCIYNMTLSNNIVSSNGNMGIYLHAFADTDTAPCIYNITVSNNTVSSNGDTGIYLHANYDESMWYASDTSSYIHIITIKNNTIFSNSGSGIYLGAHANAKALLYNITIAENVISTNEDCGIKTYSTSHCTRVDFDIILHNNYVDSNNNGIYIRWGSKTLITNSSIHNNIMAVLYEETTDNFASFNNIYQNEYGMNVTHGATVKAEQNYWGDPSGPYHVSMNPKGQGNPVNGDGVDLDIIPFLTSPMEFGLSIASFVNSYSCIMI